VIIKWYSHYNEDWRQNALSLLGLYKEGAVSLYVPELAIYEISNALRYNKNLSSSEVRESLGYFFALEISIVSITEHVLKAALDIAYRDNITVYDAVFISVSDYMKMPLVTANPGHQFPEKHRNIILLKDL
jgi:predicted nucleic acid-binding protein